jgi:hypothetical protein
MNSAAVQGESWFVVRRRRKKTLLVARGSRVIRLKKTGRLTYGMPPLKTKPYWGDDIHGVTEDSRQRLLYKIRCIESPCF